VQYWKLLYVNINLLILTAGEVADVTPEAAATEINTTPTLHIHFSDAVLLS